MCGVINLRGDVVPVVDLPMLFYGKTNEVTRFTCIVIVEVADGSERVPMGLLIDGVNEVVNIPPEKIDPPERLLPPAGGGQGSGGPVHVQG